jgi:hypothetical protein
VRFLPGEVAAVDGGSAPVTWKGTVGGEEDDGGGISVGLGAPA